MTVDTSGTPAPPARQEKKRREKFWERDYKDGVPGGAELAALRGGVGREPGTVPSMWPYYTTLNAEGRTSRWLRAEHVTLTLFALHQQSRPALAHQRGTGLGTALRALRDSDRASPVAVDRRFNAAATATSLDEAAYHLRGLVRQLRQLPPPHGLDYTQLFDDLVRWQYPESAGRVRRQWGAQYFVGRHHGSDPETSDGTTPPHPRGGGGAGSAP